MRRNNMSFYEMSFGHGNEVGFSHYYGKVVLWYFEAVGRGSMVKVLSVDASRRMVRVTGISDDERNRWQDSPNGFEVPVSEIQWTYSPSNRGKQALVYVKGSPTIAQYIPNPIREAEERFDKFVHKICGTTCAMDRFKK